MTNAQTIKTTLTSAATLLKTEDIKAMLCKTVSMRCLSDGHTLIFDTQFLNFPR